MPKISVKTYPMLRDSILTQVNDLIPASGEGIPVENRTQLYQIAYDNAYRDALESVILAFDQTLLDITPQQAKRILVDTIVTALDAYSNNASGS